MSVARLAALAQCCRPIPGDAITGVVTQSHGISVHRKDCVNIEKSDPAKHVAVSWGVPKNTRYTARLKIEGTDKPSLLADIVQTITVMDGLISNVKSSLVNNTRTRVAADVQVKDLEHLYRIMAKLNNQSGILDVTRG